jgi:hypothetical protein
VISLRAVTGTRVDLEDPREDMIEFEAIAQGLSNCCRFAGQIYNFYSVAQHSVLVSKLVAPHNRRVALMHDATEAYMGDLSRHLKHHEMLLGYRQLESRLNDVIFNKFNLNPTAADLHEIKIADDLAAIFEHVVLRTLLTWLPEPSIRWATSEGFVKTTPEPLIAMASRLPDWRTFDPLAPWLARPLFVSEWSS